MTRFENETFTVEHDRDGRPQTGYVIGRTAAGTRFAAHAHEPVTLARLLDDVDDPIGAKGTVTAADDGRNHFSF